MVVLGLLAISSLGAQALVRIAASVHADLPTGWPANGCLGAPVAPLHGQGMDGHASLCIADSGTHGIVEIEHLEAGAHYREWIAYFESPSLCSGGYLMYQIYNFDQPCTLRDLAGSQPRGSVRDIADAAVDARGTLHLDGPPGDINLTRRAQVWLLVSLAAWSPLAPLADTDAAVGRAVFNLP